MEDCCARCGYRFAPDQPAQRVWDLTPGGTLVPRRDLGDQAGEEMRVCTPCLTGVRAWLQTRGERDPTRRRAQD